MTLHIRCLLLLAFSLLGRQAQAASPAGTTNSEITSTPTRCDVAAVGGGWAGVYFAYRYLTGSSVDPTKICLFEATDRIGGRTYSKNFELTSPSGSIDKFVLDVGAYRFSPDMHLPGDVILHKLKLPTACYEPDCEPASKDFPPPFVFNYTAPLSRIVDPVTKLPAGYVTAMNKMVEELEQMGAHVGRGMKLVNIKPTAGRGTTLSFAGGAEVQAGRVLLNLPRTPMLSLPAVQTLSDKTVKILKCVKFDKPKSLHFWKELDQSLCLL